MFRKAEKKPIIKMFTALIFADKSYIEGAWLVDLLEALGFIAGVAASLAIVGIPLAVWIGYRKQGRFFRYLREYESLPGGSDPIED